MDSVAGAGRVTEWAVRAERISVVREGESVLLSEVLDLAPMNEGMEGISLKRVGVGVSAVKSERRAEGFRVVLGVVKTSSSCGRPGRCMDEGVG